MSTYLIMLAINFHSLVFIRNYLLTWYRDVLKLSGDLLIEYIHLYTRLRVANSYPIQYMLNENYEVANVNFYGL